MAAAGGDVDDLAPGPGRAPLDDEVEIVALCVGLRITVGLRPLVPQFGHLASFTARFAPSIIVGST